MPKKLSQLIVDRVDLVDRGANPDAHVVLFKRDVKKTEFTDLLNLKEFQDVVFEIMDMCMTLEDAIYSSLYAEGDRAAEIKTSIAQFAEQVSAALDSWMNGSAVEQRDAATVLQKIKARMRHMVEEGLVAEDKVEKQETPPVPKPDPPTPDPVPETVLKADFDTVQKQLTDAREAVTKAETAKAEAERIAKEETEKREFVELQARADTQYGNLPGTSEERAKVLKAMQVMPEFERTHLETMLAAGQTAMAKQFEELGTSRPPETAADVVHARAKDRLDKKLSKTLEQATDAVLREDPKLYDRYRKEQSR
jgi:hypothetical protein